MPSRYKYSTEQLLGMRPKDVGSGKDLAKATRQLLDVANKRLDRMRKQGFTNTSAFTKGQSTRGKTEAELRKMYQETQKFLNSPISTVKGQKAIRDKFSESLGIGKLSEKNYNKLIDAYMRVEELSKNGVIDLSGIFYTSVFKNIYSSMTQSPKLSVDELVQDMVSRIDDLYESTAEARKKEEKWNDFLRQNPQLAGKYKELQKLSESERAKLIQAMGEDPSKFSNKL